MDGITRSYELARRLVTHGHDVTMVTSDRTSNGRTYSTQEDGIHVLWIPNRYSNKMGFWRRIWSFARFGVLAALEMSRARGDVIYASSPPLTNTIPAMLVARIRRIPLVLEVRDLWPSTAIGLGVLRNPVLRKLSSWLERCAYRSATHIVAASPGMKEGVVATGIRPDVVSVVPNAADLEMFSGCSEAGQAFRSKHAWLGDRPLVLYAGTLGQANGVRYLVRLAHAMLEIDPDVRFLIAGEGKEEAQVRALAIELGVLERNLWMLPPLPKAEVPALFGASTISTSIFVDVPEIWPNSANKFFDALAAGKPIAINYCGWQADLIHEHEIGLVMDSRDPVGAATRLSAALHDREWLDAAGARALCLAKTRFDRDDLAADLVSVLERSARPRHRPDVAHKRRDAHVDA